MFAWGAPLAGLMFHAVMQPEDMKIPLQGHYGRHDTFFPIKVGQCGLS